MARKPVSTKTMVVTQDRVDEMLAAVQDLVGQELLVGIPAATAGRQTEPGDEPIDNATIGYIMEFGAPAANIPARPFLVPGIQNATDRVGKRFQRAAEAALDGDTQRITDEFDAAGLIAQNAVRAKITDGPFVPLAPATIAKRRSRKPPRLGTAPLLDTGQLRRSITYVVRKVNGDGTSSS